MDKLDKMLLNRAQIDARLTAEQLSQLVPLSPSAITRRLKRMRDDGTIEKEVAVLSSRLLQMRLTAIITIQLNQHAPSALADLKRFLADAPEVQICLEITGSADVLVITSTRDLSHFNEFADMVGSHSLVRRYETSFGKRQIKFTSAVELIED